MPASSLSSRLRSPWGQGVAVLLLVGAATLVAAAINGVVSLANQAMVYLVAVVLAAYWLERIASAACAVAAVMAFNFFFVPPRWTLSVEHHEHLITLASLLAVALLTNHLSASLRRESALARRSESRARQLQALASELAGAATPGDVLSLGNAALHQAFSGPCLLVAIDAQGEPDTLAPLAPSVRDGLRCCVREAALLGPGSGRWPGLDAWYLPVGEARHHAAAACVGPADAGDLEGREHAQALCAVLGQALARVGSAAALLASQAETQHRRLQGTFLAAVSHDLRTPLAAIVGAASALQVQGGRLSETEQQRLLASICSEADYLATLTDNTLQWVRLSDAPLTMHRAWESAEEIVGAVLARVRQRDPSRRIRSKVAAGLPLVRADAVMLAQLLANLLDNALHYSEGPVDLVVNAAQDRLQMLVKDRGPGIAPEHEPGLFEPFVRGAVTDARGAGLGLAVCRAIAVAHGGALSYRRRPGGGASFCLTLAVQTQPTENAIS